MESEDEVIGIVLAGGRAARLGGGDKGSLAVGNVPVLDRVLTALHAQCEHIVINAGGNAARFARYDYPVVDDSIAGQQGPLAGVLAGLDYVARHHPGVPFALTVPTDTPFLPLDLVARLEDQRVADRAAIVCARSGGATHHVIALWSVSLREHLRRALVDEGVRKVQTFLDRHPLAYVTWPVDPFDPFLNVNTPEDLAAADRIATTMTIGGHAI